MMNEELIKTQKEIQRIRRTLETSLEMADALKDEYFRISFLEGVIKGTIKELEKLKDN